MTRIRALSATTTVVLAASLLASAPAHASPGDLDRSFSGDGIVLTGFGGEIDGGAAVAVQVDGKIVIAGTTSGYDERGEYQSGFALARFDGDGSLARIVHEAAAAPMVGAAELSA